MGLFSGSNKTVVDAKRAERTRRLDANRKEFTADHDAYLCATATQIVDNIAQGKWTASDVLEAYIQRAIVAHDRTNCLTEIMFDEAREAAKKLDAEFVEKGAICGPLHGVPFSIKDQFKVKGYDTTMGFSRWTNDPANEDAVMVSQIIAAGGIPFVKTNVPQATLTFECNNPLWGRSLNPYNKGYTCGGSSGGEAALLALDGSALGIGTDIGGSLRIPPAYCGIYGFKPCLGRLSKDGVRGPSPGFEGLRTTTGPMARSVKDLELFCRALFGSTETDPVLDVAPVPFRDIQLPEKLKFGYYTTDGFIKASPANKRAVLETVEALRKQGHECVEFMPPNVHDSLAIFVSINSADAYKQMLSHFGPDPLDDGLKMLVYAAKLPGFVTSFAAWIVTTFFGDRKAAGLLPAAGAKSYGEYSKCIENRNAYERAFYQEVWHKYKFDGIICPVQAVPQLPNGGATEYSFLAAGTILYNILDSPSGVIPVSWVDPEKDKLTEEWTLPERSMGSPFIEGQIYRGKKPFYDPEGMKDMPIAIQVVGKRWDEEKVLGMMDVVDKALGERGFGPGACTSRTKAVNGGQH